MLEKVSHLQQSSDELISEEVKEIISYHPHWIIRYGNVLFLGILFFFLSLTWFISYPDMIHGSARLISLNAPKLIIARTEGKLLKLFSSNGDQVQKGTHLGYMESTSSYPEVMQLLNWIEKTIDSTKNNNYNGLLKNPLPVYLNLGELQSSYQRFQNQFTETRQILANGYYQNKEAALRKDLQILSNLKSTINQQKTLLEQDHQLQKKEYDAYATLEKEKVIASLELNQYKSKLIAKEQSLKQINSQLSNNDIASYNKVKEIMDLEKQVLDQKQQFNSAFLDLKSEIEKWIQQYVLVAPANGRAMYISSLQENELITRGQTLFYIESGQSNYYVEMMVAQKGLGKVKMGQKVILKVEGYPSEEYGSLSGVVSFISNMPSRRDSFLIKVNLPKGLTTNYNKEIVFRNNLSASAEIITDNRKLFDRLSGKMRQLWER
jgi:HlyD family secretion protein